jgi:hypothetical protein
MTRVREPRRVSDDAFGLTPELDDRLRPERDAPAVKPSLASRIVRWIFEALTGLAG